jgi:ABC-type Mn2+/Zn2+ transport system permease subunit
VTALDALALGLGTFYAAYAVARTAGPLGVFTRLRARRYIGELASCFYCVAIWAALALWLALQVTPPVVYVFAAAGFAAFAYRWTGAEHT